MTHKFSKRITKAEAMTRLDNGKVIFAKSHSPKGYRAATVPLIIIKCEESYHIYWENGFVFGGKDKTIFYYNVRYIRDENDCIFFMKNRTLYEWKDFDKKYLLEVK